MIVAKLSLPLNGTRRVAFVLPAKVVPHVGLGRMLEVNLTLAKSLNVPLVVLADPSYLQFVHTMLQRMNTDQPIEVEALKDQLKPDMLEQESISSFIVVPGFGSRKRVEDTLGNLPERLAAAFDGNMAILHFDK